MSKLSILFGALLATLVTPGLAQTYWQAPLTGDGAPCVKRTDLGTLPDRNDYTGSLVTFKEKINEGLYSNVTAQKYLPHAIAQSYLCIYDDPVYGTRCGARQAKMILKF